MLFRKLILCLFVAITLFMAYPTSQLGIDAGFKKHLPVKHPYIQTLIQYQHEFGGANRLLIAVRVKSGDIFTSTFFNTVKNILKEASSLPGVDRSTVRSIFSPNVRFIEVVEDGFIGSQVIPANFSSTTEEFERVRQNILKSRVMGQLVANDFTAILISAQLIEVDPSTGKKLNYIQLAKHLEETIRNKYASGNVDIHIIGFVKVIGDIAERTTDVAMFFGIAFFLTASLVYAFTRSLQLTILVLFCPLISVLWTLGLLSLFGFGLDPMSILVPFLVFAIGVSHAIQMINAFRAEIFNGANSVTAARQAFHNLLIPSSVALVTDILGFLTILLIEIEVIKEISITASIGVMAVLLTNLFLLPVLLSYVDLKDGYLEGLIDRAHRHKRHWRILARAVEPKFSVSILAVGLALLVIGVYEAKNVRIGDLHTGVPEFYPDSRYNRDSTIIAEKFSIGMDILTIFVETTPDACLDHGIMTAIDRLQWQFANIPSVLFTQSMPQVAKSMNVGWNEGHIKWHSLPHNPQTMVRAISPIEPSTGLLNQDCSVMPILILLKDHHAETIARVIAEAKTLKRQNDSPSLTIRLAAGNVGMMAARNEIVQDNQLPMLAWIYAAIVGLCIVTFRSWRAAICIVVPLGLVSVLAFGMMSHLDIGLKVSTLPIVALGVGIGIDYGIYILSRITRYLEDGMDLYEAYLRTLQVTGNAVLVTGLTLSTAVSTWAFSVLKLQADMGLLLTFLFFVNMLGALLLLPALVSVLHLRRRAAPAPP